MIRDCSDSEGIHGATRQKLESCLFRSLRLRGSFLDHGDGDSEGGRASHERILRETSSHYDSPCPIQAH